MIPKGITLSIILSMVVYMSCDMKSNGERAPLSYVKDQLNRLAPVELACDISHLTVSDRACLAKLIEAAKRIDTLFLLQVNPQNPDILSSLKQSKKPEDRFYLDFFSVMFGPWNRIDKDQPFLGGEPKPKGAGYYPQDMGKEEFETALKNRPDIANSLKNTFTLIQREDGVLKPIPYNQAFMPLTKKISELLLEAASLTEDTTLQKYLTLRGKAFLTDDYFESDMAWMDLAGDLEIVIGPYEVYEDRLFNYKGAYEAFLCVVDHAESKKLMAVTQYLNAMEEVLPIPDKYKNSSRGLSSPIKVVQQVFSAGDTKAGVQTTAFNLPNDERVREAKGSKKVMLKNIAQAKYEKCWIPIVNKILAPKPLAQVSFESYFNHVLMHEMSHGIGPGVVTKPDGSTQDVSKALKELYTVIEECKADVLGVIMMRFLMDKGVFALEDEYSLYASYLGGMLRSVRFGIERAHGGGVAIQFNYCMEKGAFFTDDNGKLDFHADKVLPALTELAQKILLIQATGDYNGAKAFLSTYRVLSPQLETYVKMLEDVPIDIRPSYPIVNELLKDAG